MVIEDEVRITYDDDKHAYTLDGVKVPGVTTIIDECTAKPALPWWGMRVGLAGFARLMESLNSAGWAELATANTYEEVLSGVPHESRQYFGQNDPKRKKPKTLVEKLIIEQRLSTNHVKEEAGDRGTFIHNAAEKLGLGMGVAEVHDLVPEEHWGYAAGLFDWWLDHEPEFLEQEIIVGSRAHQYCGRFDCVVRYNAGPHKGKIVLADFKTSKRVYYSHLVQLDAYDLAYEEMRLEPPGWRAQYPGEGGYGSEAVWPGFDDRHVIHLPATGRYGIQPSRLPRGCFKTYVAMYEQIQLEQATHPELK